MIALIILQVPPLEFELMTKIRDCDAEGLETITIEAHPTPFTLMLWIERERVCV